MTNFEKIKQMSVEEMIMLICHNYKCRKCVQYHRQECDGYCYNGIKEWLESEVENDASVGKN